MTVPNIVPVNTYSGNGSTTTFDFDFLVEENSQLIVQTIDEFGAVTDLTVDIDYSINELKNPNGSFITYPLPSSGHSVLSDKEKIVLSLTLPIEQDKEYKNSSKLNLSTLEYSFDYAIRLLQILSRALERCVKVQEGSDILPDNLIKNLFNAEANAKQSELNAKASELATEQYKNDTAQIKTETQAIADKALQDIGTAKTDAISAVNSTKDSAIQAVNTAKDSAISNIQTEGGKYVQEAKDWANKMDGTVDGSEYSAKHYANEAKILTAGGLNQKQITNCILEAPNGVATYSDNVITYKDGLKVLIPNGRNSDKTYKSIEHTLNTDVINDITSWLGEGLYKFFIDTDGVPFNCRREYYYEQPNEPVKIESVQVWYNTDENILYRKPVGISSNFEPREAARLGSWYRDSRNNITLLADNPLDLLKLSDKANISTFAMPSGRFIDLTLGASGQTYTAPANGYFFLYKTSGKESAYITLNSNSIAVHQWAVGTASGCTGFLPVKKGDVVTVTYNCTGETKSFRFIYAEGEK